MTDTGETPGSGDPAIATSAGIYDYWLGGTANSRADRDAAERIRRAVPEISQIAWANRGFLTRVVTWMAERGIRQFIDIGAGFPTQRATHEVAGAIAGDCRVVYTDNDPLVVARGRRMLAGVPRAAVIEADIRDPGVLLGHPETRRLIDLTQPTGLLMVAVTQFVPDKDDPWGLGAPRRPARARQLPGAVGTDRRSQGRVGGGSRGRGVRQHHRGGQLAPDRGRDPAVFRRPGARDAVLGRRAGTDLRRPVGLR
jgi:S-adenosyl methyltransferase